MRDRDHDEAMAEMFKGDTAFAAEYLNQILQDGEPADLLVALRQMALAHGGVRALAKAAELNASQLYRTLSPQGNPELRSLSSVLGALGCSADQTGCSTNNLIIRQMSAFQHLAEHSEPSAPSFCQIFHLR
jgi:probable addiction module antidote protein